MPTATLTRAIDSLASGHSLSREQSAEVLAEVMQGNATETQTAAFLIALRTKGETVDEVVGLAQTMRSLAKKVPVGDAHKLLDTAGTGGGNPTFNVSTTAALVAAGAGCTVAKHGNRSATGRSGSADLLEALGAVIDLEPGDVADCIRNVGFGFMFAPHHHMAMRHVIPVRKELAVRTIFNFLGPLTNPAGAERQVIGVSESAYLETIASALGELGGERALVISSEDGLDEISASAATRCVELRGGSIEAYTVTPEDLGVERVPEGAVRYGAPDENARLARAVFSGETGPERELTLANAGAAIYIGGHAESLRDGVEVARRTIDSGAAQEAMDRYVNRTQELARERV
jgi:anthranilate phosphoribosyltransferase